MHKEKSRNTKIDVRFRGANATITSSVELEYGLTKKLIKLLRYCVWVLLAAAAIAAATGGGNSAGTHAEKPRVTSAVKQKRDHRLTRPSGPRRKWSCALVRKR